MSTRSFWDIYRSAFGIIDLIIVVLFFVNAYIIYLRYRKQTIFGAEDKFLKQASEVLVELFPILGIVGTVYGLALTFDSSAASGFKDISSVVRNFGQALTTTFNGLVAVGLSLLLGLLIEEHEKASSTASTTLDVAQQTSSDSNPSR